MRKTNKHESSYFLVDCEHKDPHSVWNIRTALEKASEIYSALSVCQISSIMSSNWFVKEYLVYVRHTIQLLELSHYNKVMLATA